MEVMEDKYLSSFKTSRGGLKLNCDGFIYIKNNVRKTNQYWVCEYANNKKYMCKSRITTIFDEVKNMYKLQKTSNGDHNHEPDALQEKVQAAINKIKENALNNTTKKPIHIISECEAVTSSSVLSHMPSNLNLRQIIYRQRNKKDKIKEPDTIDFEIDNAMLNLNDLGEDPVFLDIKWDAKKRIILYTTEKLLRYLCSSPYLIMDGTFKVTPEIFRQIYTIHGCINSKTFPLVIALCTNKDTSTYNKLFSNLIEKCESLNMCLSPKYILMDFEKASQKSARIHFENAELKGCYFHLGQIVYRQVQEKGFQKLYGTDELFSSEIKCILALAYLSENEIPTYFDELNKNVSDNAKVIVEWFNKNYVWGDYSSPPNYSPSLWSTHDLNERNMPRTQNYAESWHNRFAILVAKHHAGFYDLSTNIILEIKHQSAEINKHLYGAPPAAKKRKYADKSTRITNIIQNKEQ